MGNTFSLVGMVTEIGSLIHVKKGDTEWFKKVLTIEMYPDQKMFLDVVNSKLQILESEDIRRGDQVKVEFSFKGTEKGPKKFNNIYCNSIKRVLVHEIKD